MVKTDRQTDSRYRYVTQR